MRKCSICGKEMDGASENAWPLSNDRCCKECYDTKVVYEKARELINMRKKNAANNEIIEERNNPPICR